jgi:uncharacterized flavoprotein (TIGR03862 family)
VILEHSQAIAVVGGGPAGLTAAEVLSQAGASVTVYERMPSLGRKFLLAGRGGLNLTHSEDLERFIARYAPPEQQLRGAIEAFTPAQLRAWSEQLGEPTFVGSSGRVFPRSFKASPLLRAWIRRLQAAGVSFALRHRWAGWDAEGRLLFHGLNDECLALRPAAVVLALGGASWPRLGSDGGWFDILAQAGVALSPLQPANGGFRAEWSEIFRSRFEGAPLKRIALAHEGQIVRGELVVTRDGLEGGSIYALSAPLRSAILKTGEALLSIDLRPDIALDVLTQRLDTPRGKQSLSTFLRKTAKLSPVAIGLLHETAVTQGKPLTALSAAAIAGLIKQTPVRLTGLAPVARAISTAGGVKFDALDAHFMLRQRPGVFIAGEMLDWEAPTGGYLLQAAFATGAAAGRGALAWLAGNRTA